MKKGTSFILLICFVLTNVSAQMPSFFKKKTLKTLTNQKIALSQCTENKPFVLIFYTTECPICQKYVPILRGVSDSFPDVKFILVFTKWDTLQAIKDFSTGSGNFQSSPNLAKITLLSDTKNKLIKKTKALTTPEAFLFNAKGQLQYRGAIDNWFYALGKYRPEATEHYLKNAITQFLKNEKITVSETKPVGCYIEY
jgi:thiol-disulfide isomerase/thioredoxin